MVLLSLLIPLILWPIIAILGSILGGIGYGFFAPLIATFEAVGENVTDKFYHCFTVSLHLYFFLRTFLDLLPFQDKSVVLLCFSCLTYAVKYFFGYFMVIKTKDDL